jgi:putative pyruvate formate lyase activating enzyme
VSWPAYLDLYESGELGERAERALAQLAACTLCPRACRVDRTSGETGVCGIGRTAVVASTGPHFGEERVLRGSGGSGTIFFCGCNLNCVFCQNWDISHERHGREVGADELGAAMLELQALGCHNINLVTPSHVVPQILEALSPAVEGGLTLPIVYNTSGYDAVETLRLLYGVVDIYMPDFKYWTDERAERFLTARDYPQRAREAIAEMHRQTGDLELDRFGIARRGVLVRHLVMPDATTESEATLSWIASLIPDTFVNVMAQYRPQGAVLDDPRRFAEIDRQPSSDEYDTVLKTAARLGLHRASAAG